MGIICMFLLIVCSAREVYVTEEYFPTLLSEDGRVFYRTLQICEGNCTKGCSKAEKTHKMDFRRIKHGNETKEDYGFICNVLNTFEWIGIAVSLLCIFIFIPCVIACCFFSSYCPLHNRWLKKHGNHSPRSAISTEKWFPSKEDAGPEVTKTTSTENGSPTASPLSVKKGQSRREQTEVKDKKNVKKVKEVQNTTSGESSNRDSVTPPISGILTCSGTSSDSGTRKNPPSKSKKEVYGKPKSYMLVE